MAPFCGNFRSMRLKVSFAASIMLLLFGILPSAAQPITPRTVGSRFLDEHPYESVGLIFSKIGRFGYRGSGAVARDQRLMYGCAHVIYDSGRWASSVRFARAYSGLSKPKPERFTKARGFHYLSGYRPTWWLPWWDWRHDYDFQDDFAVAYKGVNGSFGPPLGFYPDATRDVLDRSDVQKLIVGYPAKLAYWRIPGRHFMYQTGPFSNSLSRSVGNFFNLRNVSTGSGNSGGPVLVNYEGDWYLAGILVSISNYNRDSGIYVLNLVADEVASRALDTSEEGIRLTKISSRGGRIADGRKKSAQRVLNFSGNPRLGNSWDRAPGKSLGVPPSIRRVTFSLDLRGRRNDLKAYVRSPKGRIHYVAKPEPGSSELNISLKNLDLTEPFSASDPRGKWRVYFSDVVRGGPPARFVRTSLTLESRWKK